VSARRVAVLADVHGNAVALAAGLRELEREQPDSVVHCGDLTSAPPPTATFDLVVGLVASFDEAERRYRESGDPMASEMVDELRGPPTPAEVIAHAESRAFSG
jgi:hypothetical protein